MADCVKFAGLFLICAVCTITAFHHVTGVTEGTNGFLDLYGIRRKAVLLYNYRQRNNQQKVFPDIKFTCRGTIRKWIFVAREREDGNRNPQFEIWTTENQHMFERQSVSEAGAATVSRVSGEPDGPFFLYEYDLDQPLSFNAGNVLGIYQPRGRETRRLFQYQDGGGPQNYHRGGSQTIIDIQSNSVRSNLNDYPLVAVETDQPECTSGFLEREALEMIVEVQNVLPEVALQIHLDQQRIIPGISFTCSGTLTKWIIGAQVQTWFDSIFNSNSYPRLQILRPQDDSGRSFSLANESIIEELNATRDPNVYEHVPNLPLQFQNGDVLGISQPSSSTVLSYEINEGPSNYNPSNFAFLDRDLPLIAIEIVPQDGGDPESCAEEFIDREALAVRSLDIGPFFEIYDQQLITPGINFSAAGFIRKWTFAAQYPLPSDSRISYTQFQIWRRNASGEYRRVGNTSLLAEPARTGYLNVYEYILSPPLQVEAGDILGIYQPPESLSQVVHFPMGGVGPQTFFYSDTTMPLLTFVLSESRFAYPLVSVEFEPANPTSPPPSPTTATSQPAVTSTLPSSIPASSSAPPAMATSTPSPSRSSPSEKPPSVASFPAASATSPSGQPSTSSSPPNTNSPSEATSVTSPSPSTTLDPSVSSSPTHPTPPATLSPPPESSQPPGTGRSTSNSKLSTTVIVGTVIAILLIMVAAGALVLVVVCILMRRQGKPKAKNEDLQSSSVENPVYELNGPVHYRKAMADYEIPVPQKGTLVYQTPASDHYEVPEVNHYDHLNGHENNHHSYDLLPLPGRINIYGSLTNQSLQRHVQNYGWRIYVPTQEERKAYSTAAEGTVDATQCENHLYSDPGFFEESDTYWKPASDANGLYHQLSSKKFREIPRQQVQISEHIGSGLFGRVHLGVWQSPAGAVDVAVKTLRQGATEEDTIRFLQEAASNGQFWHPNIVELRGVVTIGQPVMMVLELLENGDLRTYLRKHRPVPGELAPPSAPHMLLGFCKDIVSGMEYLSRKAFVHRDLAARNILVATDKTCKISDFGMARDLEDESYYVSHGGKIPVKWTAPEALHFRKYSTASDVWSFGALMFEIWSLGHKPFEGYTNGQTIKLIDNGYRLPPPPGCPKRIYRLMIKCWHPQGSSRPTFSELLQDFYQSESHLLSWSEEDMGVHPQASVLGAPLEAGENLYPELQKTYKRSQY